MQARHHLLLCHHCRCAPSSALPQLMAPYKQARNGLQCQGTVVGTTATIVVAHHCSCCCSLCNCKRGQGKAINAAKALSSALMLSSLCTVIRTATIDAFTQASEAWPTMPRHHCLHHCHHHCRAPFTPLLSLPLWKRARNGRQCCQDTIFSLAAVIVVHCHPHCRHPCLCTSMQGTANNVKALLSAQLQLLSLCTVVYTAVIVGIAQEGKEWPTMPRPHSPHQRCLLPSRITGHAAAIVTIMGEGKEWPTMPRHCHPHSCHLGICVLLFVMLPLSHCAIG
jgi:hypothetical protein